MKKNNAKTILSIVGVIALVAALLYFGGKNREDAPDNIAADPHHPNAGQNVSLEYLESLVNEQTPDFSLVDRDGNAYSPDGLRGKNVILFFNEGLMCYPACWNQIVAFSQDNRFKSDDIVVLSVVIDSPRDWQQAVSKMPELAEALVVFDSGASVSKKFGALSVPSSMHPGVYPGHTYVVIDKEGTVRYVSDDSYMGIHNDQLWTEIAKLTVQNNDTL
ncbi:MAG: hypothetical protein A3J30_04370 [Candidatus Wildermuthbacteria bacterium RIFCSPLOWO2_02_FULL_47_9c]|uniref:Thioredoxin domain-containing protein n=2 Tax=Parcubacteria group TaxID=1794811 RepID=A0A837ISC5_9BACT|nr:MAG: hypothetical protein UY25_C0004G0107 [Candidatus Yanofskybacteria bacterium GW2011_GWC1_48_11]KKW04460.1 MAG: hypothetical protein UY38_C0001G0027 [Parcubacteria group bacterium GW2011_GWB1_49_12]KKW08610.1 MAG: hypothetical protein UY45_C0005G0013 [Parcubacteria group bacterium GW2011_GWA1_49_26]KKW13667.1 MAG: hypothetical protein UY53_C0009G0003 [Parcubacteria group bacterium GW2011_GWA2_50_10]OHA61588.1 MAG: hypothetical protein A2109_03615 [Candidatus Wildermuthbacteria bacterium G